MSYVAITLRRMDCIGNTHLKVLLAALGLVLATGCGNNKKSQESSADSTQAMAAEHVPAAHSETAPPIGDCKAAETLLFADEGLSSYTEDKMRGAGVVSFEFDSNDRLDIYNDDGSQFSFLVYNEDHTFYTLDMPSKITARAVVPEADVVQMDFDAEAIDTDKDYLIIYVNKEKRKVKKTAVKFTFSTWDDYVKTQEIRLKPCNMLPAANGNKEMLYQVLQQKGDEIKIKSIRDCSGEDAGFKPVEGWIKWKNGDLLTVDLTTCD